MHVTEVEKSVDDTAPVHGDFIYSTVTKFCPVGQAEGQQIADTLALLHLTLEHQYDNGTHFSIRDTVENLQMNCNSANLDLKVECSDSKEYILV